MFTLLFHLLLSLLLNWHPAASTPGAGQGGDVVTRGHVSTAPVEIPAQVTPDEQPPAASGTPAAPTQEQAPDEQLGGARCGDTEQVVVAVLPDGTPVCGAPQDTLPTS